MQTTILIATAFLAHANVLAAVTGVHQVVGHYASPQIARAYTNMANHYDGAPSIYCFMGLSRFLSQHLPMLPSSIFLAATRSGKLHNRADSLLHIHWCNLTRGRCHPSSPTRRRCLAIETIEKKEAPDYGTFWYWQLVGILQPI